MAGRREPDVLPRFRSLKAVSHAPSMSDEEAVDADIFFLECKDLTGSEATGGSDKVSEESSLILPFLLEYLLRFFIIEDASCLLFSNTC